MSLPMCKQAMSNGASLVSDLYRDGCNVVGFGEMGIGNTTTAAALLAAFSGLPAELVVGRGTGVDVEGLVRKQNAITTALEKHGRDMSDIEKLAVYGGFEVAYSQESMNRATRYYPMVGWIVGAFAALVFALSNLLIPMFPAVVLSTVKITIGKSVHLGYTAW